MRQVEIVVRKLIPEEGCFLTQAGEVPATDRVLGREVALGENDSAANWREVTAEEAHAIREAKREAERLVREAEAEAQAAGAVEPENTGEWNS